MEGKNIEEMKPEEQPESVIGTDVLRISIIPSFPRFHSFDHSLSGIRLQDLLINTPNRVIDRIRSGARNHEPDRANPDVARTRSRYWASRANPPVRIGV